MDFLCNVTACMTIAAERFPFSIQLMCSFSFNDATQVGVLFFLKKKRKKVGVHLRLGALCLLILFNINHPSDKHLGCAGLGWGFCSVPHLPFSTRTIDGGGRRSEDRQFPSCLPPSLRDRRRSRRAESAKLR